MIIRKQQMEAFDRESARNYVRSVAEGIRQEDGEEWVFPPGGSDWIQVKDLPFGVFLEMVSVAIDRATSYGFVHGDDISAFVSLMFSFAPNFDEQDTVNLILTNEDIDLEDRMNLVGEGTSDQDWDQIEENYDESAWLESAIIHG